jgi:energy-coupling factor transporter ATP-binding protein EcfA2
MAFQFSQGLSADLLVAKLAANGWRGAVIGPHGSGKSTLLRTLEPLATAAGRRILTFELHDRQRRLPHFSNSIHRDDNLLIVVDGYEQLARSERIRLLYQCSIGRAGLLVTAHRRTCLATLIQLAPDRELVVRLVADLCAGVSTSITPRDIAASHACHGSNVRAILFDLYDRHEERRRRSISVSAVT